VIPQSSMHVLAYGLVVLMFLLPCISAARVKGRVHVVGYKIGDEELFVPGEGVPQPAARPRALHANMHIGAVLDRRQLLLGSSAAFLGTKHSFNGVVPAFAEPPPATAAIGASSAMAERLLASIPSMPFGAPATNATLDAKVVADIEAQAVALEKLGQRGNARSASLNGTWRLLYSNAREITNLAAGLPLGFVLGPTYQPVDLATGRFENQGNVLHSLGIAKAATTVIGDVRPTQGRTTNAAGTVSDDGNRIDVDFQRITFELTEALGVEVKGVRKIVVPKLLADAVQPANDVLYLDATMRVTRGGDDGIFIFRREDGGSRPLLSAAQREEIFAEGGAVALTGKGIAGDDPNAPPELRKLLKGRSADSPF